MFGHDSLPSKVFSYGAKTPIENFESVKNQMYLAHKYRNALVQAELERRELTDKALASTFPALEELEATIKRKENELEALRTNIKTLNVERRDRTPSKDEAENGKRVRNELQELWTRRKELRKECFSLPEWKIIGIPLEAEHKAKLKKLYAESGCYWGTTLHINQSCSDFNKGAPPHFMSSRGDGHLAMQVQGGMTMDELLSGVDTRVQLGAVPDEAWKPGGRHLRKTTVKLRIGSNSDRTPIFATIPIVYHRPIPQDGVIKWVHLIRRMVGTKPEWRLQFVVSRREGWQPEDLAIKGIVGLDLGWRRMPDGGLRVASWRGNDGEKGTIVLPSRWQNGMDKVNDIQSIRDKNFNTTREKLMALLGRAPEWLKDETKSIGQWRSIKKLAKVSNKWREKRFEGDEEIYGFLENWRKQDKHLLEYSENLRDQLQRQRLDVYRNFAAFLRRRYRKVVLEKLKKGLFQECPEAEDIREDAPSKENRKRACLSNLRTALSNNMAALEEVGAAYTSQTCPDCGAREKFEPEFIEHKCSSCGSVYDRDDKAALNILRRASEYQKKRKKKGA